jgi:hypothetical protein
VNSPITNPAHPTILKVVPSRFVTIELAEAMTGLSASAIRTKIGKGVWLEGRQYVRREGRVFVDMKGYEQWVEMGQE